MEFALMLFPAAQSLPGRSLLLDGLDGVFDFHDGHVYLTLIGICLIPEAAALCMAAALRAHGHTRDAMYVTLIANKAVAGVDSKDVKTGMDLCWGNK